MIQEQINKLRNGDRNALARCITLAESLKADDQEIIHKILKGILPYTGHSIRIGITGSPGVGKSTFIESFGSLLTATGKKVAVLTIDPSSPLSKGSILGDKTRMEKLSKDSQAFIRPSASRNLPGGVSHATRESILLCEAAGFDIIIVETVGVGQSEFSVKDMTDCFLLLMLAGAGDELQGIKKGIMEMADIVAITKADGDNLKKAQQACSEYQHALHLIRPDDYGWSPKVVTCSALQQQGLSECLGLINHFVTATQTSGRFRKTRKEQQVLWLKDQLNNQLKKKLMSTESFGTKWKEATAHIEKNDWTVFEAVDYLTETTV